MKCRVLLTLLSLLFFCSTAAGQFYFGKNKIQYSHFDWKVLHTTHFKVYFYEDAQEIAQIAAAAAEESYKELSDKFSHHVFKKIPLIIYSSPTFFTQTNVTAGMLPESVAGFTEFYKGRVVVPFNGNVADFRRVIKHELVHVFTIDIIISNVSTHRKTSYYGPPLWFTEGLAEFWSREWNREADMILADMTLEGNISNITDLGYLSGSFFMYKYGESFCHFIADNYGEDKLMMLFKNWWKAKNFRSLFALTVGKSLKDVGKEWVYYLKKRYYPLLTTSDLPNKVSTPVTERVFAVKPVALNIEYKGADDWIVYKANKLGYSGIYMCSPSTGKEETLIKGERSAEFESLHLLQSKLGTSSDGRLAFVSKRHEKDVLYIYDICARKIMASFQFPRLFHLSSPAWSDNNRKVVFSGSSFSGISDLFMLNLEDSTLTQLTDDIYYDTDPTFDSDGNIFFASDRGSYGYKGFLNLYCLEPHDNLITPITYGSFDDSSPSCTEDGLLFSSDRNGAPNIYLLTDSSELKRITDFATGAFDPKIRDGQLIFTGYQGFTFSIYSLDLDPTQFVTVETEQPLFTTWNPEYLSGKYAEGVIDYDSEFSFDLAQSAVSYDAVYGTMGGFQTVVSDMLGNQMYYLLIANTADTKDDLLKAMSVGITYVNKTRRVNYGFGAFHLFNEYFDRVEGLFSERQSGIQGMISYPLSKFTRVETSLFLRHSYKKLFLFERDRHAILSTNYISFVHDNSLWDVSGPIDGMRYNGTLGLTTDFKSGKIFNRLAFVDFRNYLRIRKFSAFATRVFYYTSVGDEPQRIYFGGSWSLRGYNRREFYASNVFLFSNELRFPLIDALYIGFPFGRIGFRAIRGALFVDAGSAWNNEFEQVYGSVGVGARVSLGCMAVLRFDLAKRTDFESFDHGVDFDFFFGWNF